MSVEFVDVETVEGVITFAITETQSMPKEVWDELQTQAELGGTL